MWHGINQLPNSISRRWILVGDFNKLRRGPDTYYDLVPNDFQTFIALARLFEMHMKGSFYTWSNGSIGDQRVDSHIDRALVNDIWL